MKPRDYRNCAHLTEICAAKDKRIESLEAELKQIHKFLDESEDECRELEQERDGLLKVNDAYAGHLDSCYGKNCNCGFKEAMDKLDALNTKESE